MKVVRERSRKTSVDEGAGVNRREWSRLKKRKRKRKKEGADERVMP